MKDIWAYDPDICDGEIWKPIDGYEDAYEVSNFGRVRRKTYVLIKGKREKGGYRRVKLSSNGREKSFLVHRLVAAAFIQNPLHLPCVNHKDEHPENNRASNLEWCTHEHNMNWGTRNKRISEHSANKRAVICVDMETGEKKRFPSISSASKAVAGKTIGGSSISEAACGMRKSAYGKYWFYEKEESDADDS